MDLSVLFYRSVGVIGFTLIFIVNVFVRFLFIANNLTIHGFVIILKFIAFTLSPTPLRVMSST